ncbi:MAG: hypothetical protein KGM24_05230, partial [Elusimicrobia bacterium]|nr:hypothetical protein [Elusimicrobiota bacterium]
RACRAALNACADRGEPFSACVQKRPDCENRAVRGCCPSACRQVFGSALDGGSSEAAAFRRAYSPDSPCALPPKSDDD